MSRTKNSLHNIMTAIGTEIISLLLRFGVRTIFINSLGATLLGANALIVNIISLITLTELGFGTAITFHLYKPIYESDNEKTKQLLYFFKNVYSLIGIIILIFGILVIPFIQLFIKEEVPEIDISIIFGLYLIQTVSSYLFYAYKHTLLRAHQKEYIINRYKVIFSMISSVLQIIVLLYLKNFYLYVIILITTNIAMNLAIASHASKSYHELLLKPDEKLSSFQKTELFKDSCSIIFYKLYDKITGSVGSIYLSYFSGLTMVGLYSNYMLILSTINIFLSKFYTSIVASISDVYVSKDKVNIRNLFSVINFFTIVSFGTVSLVTFFVIDDFITVWIGQDFILSLEFKVLFSIHILIMGYKQFFDLFRTSTGLFQKAKYRPIVGTMLNLSIAYLLVKNYDATGLLAATIITNILTFMWYDPFIICKYGINYSFKIYVITNAKYLGLFTISSILSMGMIFSISPKEGLNGFIVKFLVVSITNLAVIIFPNLKTKEFKYIVGKLLGIKDRL